MPPTRRRASHAGSWYDGDGPTLDAELEGWLSAVEPSAVAGANTKLPVQGARVIIAPHAGYSYSGPAAAWAYKSWDLTKAKRVFLLGPSHHIYLDSCALSSCDTYATPLGDLPLDKEVTKQLYDTGGFAYMSKAVDEDEHSLEMHLPYIYKMLEVAGKTDVKVVPIMVGSINAAKEKMYGGILKGWLEDEETTWVVSSDFCHWGTRFSYTQYYPSAPPSELTTLSSSSKPSSSMPIYTSIEALDREGMDAVETGEHDTFCEYAKRTKNTICGRHPIGVVMAGIEALQKEGEGKFKFVRYEQSSRCKTVRDSSVSYASAYAVL